jgi:hypothetical protein
VLERSFAQNSENRNADMRAPCARSEPKIGEQLPDVDALMQGLITNWLGGT